MSSVARRVWRSRSAHRARRFWWALTARSLRPTTRAWVDGYLLAGERELFDTLTRSDQRHHVQVARRMIALVGESEREWVAAALLHDVGKAVCGLGTLGRVVATLMPWCKAGDGRVARYHRHEQIGASLLLSAGSSATTAALVGKWDEAPQRAAKALFEADDL